MSELDRLESLLAMLAARLSPNLANDETTERAARDLATLEVAFFLLGWAQVEAEINAAAKALVERRRKADARDERRGFDIYDPRNIVRELPLERRAGLVVDPASAAFDDLKTLYELRNKLAHGRERADSIAIPSAFARLKSIANAIETEAKT
jgi:flagellar motor protein MotB